MYFTSLLYTTSLSQYAKGTLLFPYQIPLELLIKLLFTPFPSRYLFAIAYIPYLVLEEGSPSFQADMHSTLLTLDLTPFIHIT